MPSSIVWCSSLFYMKHRYSSGKSNMWRSQQLNSHTVKVNMIGMIHCFSFLDLSEQTLGKYNIHSCSCYWIKYSTIQVSSTFLFSKFDYQQSNYRTFGLTNFRTIAENTLDDDDKWYKYIHISWQQLLTGDLLPLCFLRFLHIAKPLR